MDPLRAPLMLAVSRHEQALAWQALDLLQAGLWSWTPEQGMQRDPACLRLLGLAAEDEDDLSWLDRVHPDDSPQLLEAMSACLEGREPTLYAHYRILHHDGRYVRVEERARHQPDGSILGAVRLCQPVQVVHELALVTDPLTGLDSRVRFEQGLAEQLQHPDGEPFCLLRFTVDHKAKIMQLFGEVECDAMLAKLARLVRRELRKDDPFARWDEDSFILMLSGTDRLAGIEIAERLRSEIADASLLPGRPVTVSGGLVQYQEGEQIDHLLARLASCHGQARREFNAVIG